MFTVHHLENSRSQRLLWLLEELGAAYEVVRYERDPQTMLAPESLKAVHPLGKSPILSDGDTVIAETGAIFDYLERRFPDSALFPDPDSAAGRAYRYWLHYAEGSAMTPLLLKLVFTRLPKNAPALLRPVVKKIAAKTEEGFIDPRIKEHADFWEGELAASGHFAGDSLSAADIVMSFPLEAAATRADLGGYPRIKAFVKRVHEREAYKRALERGGPYAYA